MTAWVLIIAMGYTNIVVPGIASKEACEALASAIIGVEALNKGRCFSYLRAWP